MRIEVKNNVVNFADATVEHIPQIQIVRNAVKENQLSNPALVSDEDCRVFLTERGKGWVALVDNNVVGFSIVDLVDYNVWALFVDPNFEAQGIGKRLHDMMLDWYFSQTSELLWLGTAPGTRAEKFYKMQNWTEAGLHGRETKFEMSADQWLKN